MAASLAADNEFPSPPVHIVQLQARDLDRAQAQPRDQRHDREVADANRAAAVTAVEHPLDVGGGHGGRRQGSETPPTNWRHGRPERQRCDALQIQESQDRAQLRHPPLGRPGRDATTLPQQEGVDVHPGQRGRLEHPSGRRLFLQEAACGVLVTQHRHRGQATFPDHPAPVLPQQRTQRGDRRLLRRDDTGLPQITQQRHHRARTWDAPVASRPPGGQERRGPLLIELRRFEPLTRQPHAHLAQVLEHVPDRPRRVAPLHQPRPIPLDLRPQQTGLPPRTCHHARLPHGSPVPPQARLRSARNYAETPTARTTHKPTTVTGPRPDPGASSA